MSEIQSAEELALKIERIGQMRCENPDCKVCAEHKKEAAGLIRARDKATVELTLDIVYKKYGLVVESDDVLRGLGGEQ